MFDTTYFFFFLFFKKKKKHIQVKWLKNWVLLFVKSKYYVVEYIFMCVRGDPTARLFSVYIIRHSTIPAHFPSPKGFHLSCFLRERLPLKFSGFFSPPLDTNIYRSCIAVYIHVYIYIQQSRQPSCPICCLKNALGKYTLGSFFCTRI